MSTPSHDFVTVDMRELKAALVTRAKAERKSVSALVRQFVGRALGPADGLPGVQPAAPSGAPPTLEAGAATVKLSIRLTAAEAHRLDGGAQAAGLSRGAYLAALIAGVPVVSGGGDRAAHLRQLAASNAEVATLSRDIHHLTTLLSRGDSQAAKPYRAMLDTLGDDVRRHLRMASMALADLQPARVGSRTSRQP